MEQKNTRRSEPWILLDQTAAAAPIWPQTLLHRTVCGPTHWVPHWFLAEVRP